MKTKIGIDYSSAIGQKTGIGRFAADLTEALQKKDSSFEFFLQTPSSGPNLNVFQRLVWENKELPSKLRRLGIRLVYSPGFAPPREKWLFKIVTVHDLIGLIYPANNRLPSRFYWAYWLPRAVKNAQLLIASSESTKRDIEKYLKVPSHKIRVVPLAANPQYKKMQDQMAAKDIVEKYRISKPFLIAVSSLEPRKNHLKILQAMLNLHKKGLNNFSLVIVGKDAGAGSSIRRFIKESNLENSVFMLGYLTDFELSCLYNSAIAYVQLSAYEGFGLSVLEAMGSGLTGMVANRSSLPEIVADTALLVDPDDPREVERSMQKLVYDKEWRFQSAEKAYRRSKSFSIERMADSMLDIFKEASMQLKGNA